MSVSIAIPMSDELAKAIVRCEFVEPHIMAAFVVNWQRLQREAAEAKAAKLHKDESVV